MGQFIVTASILVGMARNYYKTRYKASICCLCGMPRGLQLNGKCRKCNKVMGLKQCPRCRTLLPKFWFYRGQSACKGCRKWIRAGALDVKVRSSKAKPRR